MLVLTRKEYEAITVETPAGPIVVKVLRVGRGQARIGIEAPPDWRIMRNELLPRDEGGQGQG